MPWAGLAVAVLLGVICVAEVEVCARAESTATHEKAPVKNSLFID